ncbi:hypothetical protein BGX29_011607 [Mortierella sp. GBA35]|nr:hypothetical protein BGX29_011607 [Mortierella sp. GBA35]
MEFRNHEQLKVVAHAISWLHNLKHLKFSELPYLDMREGGMEQFNMFFENCLEAKGSPAAICDTIKDSGLPIKQLLIANTEGAAAQHLAIGIMNALPTTTFQRLTINQATWLQEQMGGLSRPEELRGPFTIDIPEVAATVGLKEVQWMAARRLRLKAIS